MPTVTLYQKSAILKQVSLKDWVSVQITSFLPPSVLPAHYRVNSGKSPFTAIPFDHEGVCNLDLLSAATGALVSVVYYLLKDRPEEQFPYVVKKRIIFELYKHVLTPYKQHTAFWWRGYNGLPVNTWCARITSNVHTTAAIV